MRKTNLENVQCKYDWVEGERWRLLKVVNIKNSKGMVDLLLGKRDTLIEMYRLGYLTGQALYDAERIAK